MPTNTFDPERTSIYDNAPRWRLFFVIGVVGILFLVIIGRQVLLMVNVGSIKHSLPQSTQLQRSPQVLGQRADILDRHGRILATDKTDYVLYARPKDILDYESTIDNLLVIFPDFKTDKLKQRLSQERGFQILRPYISGYNAERVHALGEPGLILGRRTTRVYPQGAVAAHVLGGMRDVQQHSIKQGYTNKGIAGVEAFLNNRLSQPEHIAQPVILSIDSAIQAIIETVMRGVVVANSPHNDGAAPTPAVLQGISAASASAILIDVHTGEIMSLLSLPDFDPNYRSYAGGQGTPPAPESFFNTAVQGVYELGSIIKPLPIALALEKQAINPNTIVDLHSPITIGRYTIRDYKDLGHALSVRDIVLKSSNIGVSRIVRDKTGLDAYIDFLQQTGILSPIKSVQLNIAQTTFALLPRKPQLTTAYGHGVSISPLQLVTAYVPLINGGIAVPPTLLRQNKNTYRQSVPRGKRVVSKATSATIRDLLIATVDYGTARGFAQVTPYPVGGKTGTAEMVKQGVYQKDNNISSFICFFPIDKPRYLLFVGLQQSIFQKDGTVIARTAGATAVPVAAYIVDRIAPLLSVVNPSG